MSRRPVLSPAELMLQDFIQRGQVAQEAIDRLTKLGGPPPGCAHAEVVANVCAGCGSQLDDSEAPK